MSEDPILGRRGVSLSCRIAAISLVMLLLGCSQDVSIELQNYSGSVITANDLDHGRIILYPSARAIVRPANQLAIERDAGRITFDLHSLPGRQVHTTWAGFKLFAVFDGDSIFAGKKLNGKIVRLQPQPEGFPLVGNLK